MGDEGDAEVDTVSPEDSLPSDDVVGGSEESNNALNRDQKSQVQPFHLKGMSSSFSQRSQSIFDCLEGAAKQAVPSMAEDNVIDGRFKRPLPPPNVSNKIPMESPGRQRRPSPFHIRSQTVPDYIVHPERWTKYSLEDVSESSDKTNRSAAMEFLEGLTKSRGEQSSTCPEGYAPSFNQDPSSSGAGRIVFTKPTKLGSDRSERKRAAAKENEEAKPINLKQELKGKPPNKLDTQNEAGEVIPDTSESGLKEVEDEKQLKLEKMIVQRSLEADSSEADEERVVVTMGFHGSKKRDRKHFRPKASHDEGEEES
ncbi:Protein TSSC4 [Varanus komodoensis]|nr:Protein TSSC4 [Varanus komodoensis]